MNNQARVQVADGLADGFEKLEPLRDGGIRPFQVRVQRLTPNKLHDQEGTAMGIGAAVHEAHDAGMIEAGEDLPLLHKFFAELSGIQSGP